MIRAVFFDMGGVLLPLYVDRCIEAYRNVAGFSDIDRYIDPCHQRGFFLDNEIGKYGMDEFIGLCLEHCPPGTAPETIVRCHDRFFGTPDPDNVALVKELGKKYDVYLLSNNNALSMSLHRPNFASAGLPLDTSFKAMFLSHEMHMLKPSPEIYLRSLELSGHTAAESLFIDDSQANIDGALSVGMHALLYKPGTSLRQLVYSAL